jgi:hypothetical protein
MKIIVGLLVLSSATAFAEVDEHIVDAKSKIAKALGTHIEELTDGARIMSIGKYGPAYSAPQLTRAFGETCIKNSFGNTTSLTNSMGDMKVSDVLDPILIKCYGLTLTKTWNE